MSFEDRRTRFQLCSITSYNIGFLFVLLAFLVSLGAISGAVQGLCLALHPGITTGRLGDPVVCQGSNPGSLMQTDTCLLYYCSSP